MMTINTVKECKGSIDVDGSAEYVLAHLETLITAYGAHKVSLSLEQARYDDHYSVCIYVERPETTKESDYRLTQEVSRLERAARAEKEMFLKLSKKYASDKG